MQTIMKKHASHKLAKLTQNQIWLVITKVKDNKDLFVLLDSIVNNLAHFHDPIYLDT